MTLKLLAILLKMSKPEDLIKFGLIPEFIGRLPVITTLETLEQECLNSNIKRAKECADKTV